MIDTILAYDATGGGTLAVVPPCSLTIKKDGHLIGYFYDGISAEDLVITNTNNTAWEAGGFKLPATSSGSAILGDDPIRWFTHKIPVKAKDVLTLVGTSGANPVYAGIYVEYPGGGEGLAFEPRKPLDGEGHLVTKATTAGGTNCGAGTLVQGATNITGWGTDRAYTPCQVKARAAFTTTAFLGLRKAGGDNVLFIVPIGLTDIANNWKPALLPKGLFTMKTGEEIEVFWSSVSAEQPTADINFVY